MVAGSALGLRRRIDAKANNNTEHNKEEKGNDKDHQYGHIEGVIQWI